MYTFLLRIQIFTHFSKVFGKIINTHLFCKSFDGWFNWILKKRTKLYYLDFLHNGHLQTLE